MRPPSIAAHLCLTGLFAVVWLQAPELREPEVPRSAPLVATGEPQRFLVRFEDTVFNPSSGPLREVRCDLLLPFDDARQRVRWIRLSDHDWRFSMDAHGERVASAVVAELAPGEATTFGWLASVELSASRHLPRSDAPGVAPWWVRALYLGDDPVFDLESDQVRTDAALVRSRATGGAPAELARAAFDLVRERVRYERAPGWDPAPEVLARGSGSCSEATYALIALCRRLGVPARWTGGTLLRRAPRGRPVDTAFHRVAEVWLPGHGWMPLDPSSPADGGIDEPAFGSVHRGFLLLSRGDAGADAPTGHAYTALRSWREPVREPGLPPVGRSRRWATWSGGVVDRFVSRGALAGLRDGYAPSIPRAEVLLADAEGYGPARDAAGHVLHPLTDAATRDPERCVSLLFAAGSPGAIRAAARLARGADEQRRGRLRVMVWEHCARDVAAEVVELLEQDAATFEAWWQHHGADLGPLPRGEIGDVAGR